METLAFDIHQFAETFSKHPVSARLAAGGEWETTGIDFSDYSRMQQHNHTLAANRRYPTPEWALNDEQLLDVLLCYLEARAFYHALVPMGTHAERLERVRLRFKKILSQKSALLDSLCKDYVHLKKTGAEPNKLRFREQVIESLDTEICVLQADCPGVILRIVHLYYRCGFESVVVGKELSLKPPHVRQILWRLNEIADPDGTDRSAAAKTWRKQPQLSQEDCESIARQRLAGKTLEALSDDYDISVDAMKFAFDFYEIPFPGRPIKIREVKPHVPRTPKQVKPTKGRIVVDPTRALFLWNRGESLQQIAERFAEVTPGNVLQSINAAVARGELLVRPLAA